MFLVLIWWSLNTKKLQHSTLYWGLFWGLFWLILMYVPIFLENSSIFSCEILYRCSWYSTLKFFMSCPPGAYSSACFSISTEPFHIFSWNFVYSDVCGTTLTVTTLKYFIHIIYFSAGGHFWVFLDPLFWCMFLQFSRIVQYFLMKFCTDVFCITLPVTTLKKFFTLYLSLLEIILGYFGGPFGIFLGSFWKLSREFCTYIFPSFRIKWWKIFQDWTWPISVFNKNLPSCYNIYKIW